MLTFTITEKDYLYLTRALQYTHESDEYEAGLELAEFQIDWIQVNSLKTMAKNTEELLNKLREQYRSQQQ